MRNLEVVVVTFENLETGEIFDTTVSPTPDGQFSIDEKIIDVAGPFFTFTDGVALFRGLYSRAVVGS